MTKMDIHIVKDGDPGPFPDLASKTIHVVNIDRVVVLQKGTDQGLTSVALFANMPDGSVAMIETTARLLDMLHGATVGARQSWGESVS